MSPTTRRTLETTMRHRPCPRPATRDARGRQLPTVTSHAVPTREYQSDPPSLPRAIRCSRPRGDPTNRTEPLDVLLHISEKYPRNMQEIQKYPRNMQEIPNFLGPTGVYAGSDDPEVVTLAWVQTNYFCIELARSSLVARVIVE